eukprot:6455219-Amphidinium_carterae.2
MTCCLHEGLQDRKKTLALRQRTCRVPPPSGSADLQFCCSVASFWGPVAYATRLALEFRSGEGREANCVMRSWSPEGNTVVNPSGIFSELWKHWALFWCRAGDEGCQAATSHLPSIRSASSTSLVAHAARNAPGFKCLYCGRFQLWSTRASFDLVECERLKARALEKAEKDCQRFRVGDKGECFGSVECTPIMSRGTLHVYCMTCGVH